MLFTGASLHNTFGCSPNSSVKSGHGFESAGMTAFTWVTLGRKSKKEKKGIYVSCVKKKRSRCMSAVFFLHFPPRLRGLWCVAQWHRDPSVEVSHGLWVCTHNKRRRQRRGLARQRRRRTRT